MIIGINAYQTWPKLNYAVNDARSVRKKLLQLSFEPQRIVEVYDRQATAVNISRESL